MVSFYWNDLVEPPLPYFSPFQIRVEVNSKRIYRWIVDEGSSTIFLSSLAWQDLGSLEILSASQDPFDFDRCPSKYLVILSHFPISLGGKIVLVNVEVVQGSLDLNMLLGRDYAYDMNILVSMLFWVMHFPHNRIIVTIDKLASDNHHPNLVLVQVAPYYVPSVHVDSTPPCINYVAYYP